MYNSGGGYHEKNFRSNELVAEVIDFIEKDKKRPICTPFSK